MDISTRARGIAGRLSNLTRRHFIFLGVECESIEGVLQAFKFKDPNIQREICKYWGQKAKKSGASKNWNKTQTLYWQGEEIKRDSKRYHELLDILYQSAFNQCKQFKKDIEACKGVTFTHSLGKRKIQETVLTRQEFLSRLTKLKDGETLWNESKV